jgi:hypothetical protein
MKPLRHLIALGLTALASIAASAATVTVNPPATVNLQGYPTDVQRHFIINPDGTIASFAPGQGAGGPAQGIIVSGDQAYTLGAYAPLNMTSTGRLKVGVSSAGNIVPAAQLVTTISADMGACIYRTPVSWTVGWTGGLQCDANGDLAVSNKGGPNTPVSGQVSIGTTATPLVAARNGRQAVIINSTAATVFYLGGPTVTSTTGLYVAAAAGASTRIDTAGPLYAVVATGTLTLSYLEVF